jgi:nitroimidazol reductase NimA-like FMN-containing flavoprotein (pyridoxamine 5'-phosphate oxidase superfamily)
MKTPKITRPTFPQGYVDNPTASVTWEYVEKRLSESKNYWMSSVRPNGRPHVIPRWAVFIDGKIYYDGSPETRHAQNIVQNPHVALHLESGDQALIAEGVAKPAGKPAAKLAKRIAQAYSAKYKDFGYDPEPNQWDDGGLYEFTPHKILAWTKFNEDPTKFVLD